jgi:hypothetical protein
MVTGKWLGEKCRKRRDRSQNKKGGISAALYYFEPVAFADRLDKLDVLGLPALGALGHIELDLLALLQ